MNCETVWRAGWRERENENRYKIKRWPMSANKRAWVHRKPTSLESCSWNCDLNIWIKKKQEHTDCGNFSCEYQQQKKQSTWERWIEEERDANGIDYIFEFCSDQSDIIKRYGFSQNDDECMHSLFVDVVYVMWLPDMHLLAEARQTHTHTHTTNQRWSIRSKW